MNPCYTEKMQNLVDTHSAWELNLSIRNQARELREQVLLLKGDSSYKQRLKELKNLCKEWGVDTEKFLEDETVISEFPSPKEQKIKLVEQLYELYKNAYSSADFLGRATDALADDDLKTNSLRLTILKQFVRYTDIDRDFFERYLLTGAELKKDCDAKTELIISRLSDDIFSQNGVGATAPDTLKKILNAVSKKMPGLQFSETDRKNLAENKNLKKQCGEAAQFIADGHSVAEILKKITDCPAATEGEDGAEFLSDIKAAVRRAAQEIPLEGTKKISWYQYIHKKTMGKSPLGALVITLSEIDNLEALCGIGFVPDSECTAFVSEKNEKFRKNRENTTPLPEGTRLIKDYCGELVKIYKKITGSDPGEGEYSDGTKEFKSRMKTQKGKNVVSIAESQLFNSCTKVLTHLYASLNTEKYTVNSKTGKDYLNDQLREYKPCSLLSDCDAFARGVLWEQVIGVDFFFRYAIVFGMKYFAGSTQTGLQKNDPRDIEKLFSDYYSENLVGYFGIGDTPGPERINYKNFSQLIYLRVLCDDTLETPQQKLDAAERISTECIKKSKEEKQCDVKSVYKDDDITAKYKTDFIGKLLKLSEDEFITYLSKNFAMPRKDMPSLGIMSYAVNTVSAEKEYKALLEKLEEISEYDNNGEVGTDKNRQEVMFRKEMTEYNNFLRCDNLYKYIKKTYKESDNDFVKTIDKMKKRMNIFTQDYKNCKNVTRTRLIALYCCYFAFRAVIINIDCYDDFGDVLENLRGVYCDDGLDSILERAGYRKLSEKNLFDMYAVYTTCMQVFDMF